jgi:penicillin-binding protein 1A
VASRPREVRQGRRALKFALIAVAFVVAAFLALLAGAYVSVAQTLPTLHMGDRIASPQTTKIYDASETPVLLAELHGLENRDVLTGDQIPQVMRDAVVAAEDTHFYEHKGVAFAAIVRAAWEDLRRKEVTEGGSAITQRLIKDAFLSDPKTLDRKVREVALVYQLESRWSKERILNEYLNVVYFGSGAYGVEAAARSYFGVDAKDLTLAQGALLAGLPKAPSAYSPRLDPAASLTRRDLVLNKMYQQGFITSEQLQEALAAPLQLADDGADAESKAPYWVDLIREQLVARYGSSEVLGGGLTVYTSLNLRMQQAAERAVGAVLDQPGDPSAALVAIDAHSGRVVAMVGGNDFAKTQFNLATQAHRNPGSAFKPFVLVAAMQKGISPEATYASGPFTVHLGGETWQVPSIDEGPLTVARAAADSSDGVFARLLMEVGADAVTKAAADMGIASPLGTDIGRAILLGRFTGGVTPLEMATAYATLADSGERLSGQIVFDPSKADFPVSIAKVTDSQGHIIDDNGTIRTRAIDPGLAQLATDCLRGVITDGTGGTVDIGRPAAGKTGTSDDDRDAWCVGYTPDLVAAVWVGYPDDQQSASGVQGTVMTGDVLSAEIWARFMKEALAGTPPSDFSREEANRWTTVQVCSESRLLPTDLCPSPVKMLFRTDLAPVDTCDIHVPKAVFMPDVVGLSLSKAKKLLAEANLKVRTVQDALSLQPAGTVIRQNAQAGKPILQGSEVVLRVSAGQATTAPAVVDLTLDQAQAALAKAGLRAEVTEQAADALPGTVLSQDPAAGKVIAKGSAVYLVVSTGPATPPST